MLKSLFVKNNYAIYCIAAMMLGACAQEASPPISASITEMPAVELYNRIENNSAPLIIDVRSSEEFFAGHLPGALNVAHNEFVDSPAESIALLPTDKDAEIVVHCVSGKRAGIAMEIMINSGYTNINHLVGDYSGWQAAGYPVEIEQQSPTN